MTTVDKVKSICKERKIPISRLERDLGYANGYIGQLRKGTFPNDRLVEIANYLGITTAYLTGEEQNKKSPAPEGAQLSEAKRAFIEKVMQMDDSMVDALNILADQILSRRDQ